MNIMNKHQRTLASWTAATVAVLGWSGCVSTPASAQSAKPQPVIVVDQAQEGKNKHTLEIRLADGRLTVKRDGEVIPDARIRREDGRIVIVDRDGREIDAPKLKIEGHDGALQFGWGMEGLDPAELEAMHVAHAGPPPKVMLGLQMGQPDAALAKHLGIKTDETTLITGLYEGLPAHAAGMDEFDVITAVDGKTPADSATIRKALADKNPQDTIKFSLIHAAKPREVSVILAAYDPAAMEKAKLIGGSRLLGSLDPRNRLMDELMAAPRGGMAPRVFVAPGGDARARIEELLPRVEAWRRLGDAAPRREGVERELERVHERLNELERMLEKLLAERERPRGSS